MTFFTVFGRALKRLSSFWNYRDVPSVAFKWRAAIYFFSLIFLFVSIPMLYSKVYLPYEGYQFPPLSKMNVDSGTWVSPHKRGAYYYLLTQDDKKVLFDTNTKIGKFDREQCKSVGLNPMSKYCPDVHVKIWWFPRPNTKANGVGQLEIDGAIISSYEQEYKEFLRMKDHTRWYWFLKILFALALTMLAWETIVQYIKYKQENK